MKYLFILLAVCTLIIVFAYSLNNLQDNKLEYRNSTNKAKVINAPEEVANSSEDNSNLIVPSARKILPSTYHVYQTFNNCGTAALSMTLHYYGLKVSQQELGLYLRTFQNPSGDNDDKSVTMEELATKSKDYGLMPYFRPNGSIELIKKFITLDIPVITKTWLTEEDDIGHYRVVKGYDDATQSLIQDDSYQGPNIWYTNENFNNLWNKHNFEFLVLIPNEKLVEAKIILGALENEENAWKLAVINSKKALSSDPHNINDNFNLVVALTRLNRFDDAIKEYERIENNLSTKILWYQWEPIYAYYKVGNYEKAIELIDMVLSSGNRAFSELYIIRGNIYIQRGQRDLANKEYELAKFYNKNIFETTNIVVK